ENTFSPSTPRAGLLGKPNSRGNLSGEHTCVHEKRGSRDVMEHNGVRKDASLPAPVTHKKNYEKQPRRKMKDAKRGIEGHMRKRKRDRREVEDSVGKIRQKRARAEGHLLQRVLSPGGNDRDRLTLPPTYKTGLFKKGRASCPVKTGVPDLIFSEMRFLAEAENDRGTLNKGSVVSRNEEGTSMALALEASHSHGTQKSSEMAGLNQRVHNRELLERKRAKDRVLSKKHNLIKIGCRTSETSRGSSLTSKKSLLGSDGDIRRYFSGQPALACANLASSEITPGQKSQKKTKSAAVNSNLAGSSKDLRKIPEEKVGDYMLGKSRTASDSTAARESERRGTPQNGQDGELVTQELGGKRTNSRNDGQYKKVRNNILSKPQPAHYGLLVLTYSRGNCHLRRFLLSYAYVQRRPRSQGTPGI
ncbi:hypothetical protein L873DRAFT_1695452, partial [Choiromyces venosus 120613-1]